MFSNNFQFVSRGVSNQLIIHRMFAVNLLQRSKNRKILESLAIPEKPKRPLNPYLRFYQKTRPQLLEQYPKAGIAELSRATGKLWKVVDKEIRDKLEALYKEEQKEYEKAMLEYNTNLSSEQKEAIQTYTMNEKFKKSKREQKKVEKELGKPKKPANSFFLFLKTFTKDADVKHTEWVKIIGDKWKNLNEADKQRFRDESEKLKLEYEKELAAWVKKIQNVVPPFKR